jgi:hypothetical protein
MDSVVNFLAILVVEELYGTHVSLRLAEELCPCLFSYFVDGFCFAFGGHRFRSVPLFWTRMCLAFLCSGICAGDSRFQAVSLTIRTRILPLSHGIRYTQFSDSFVPLFVWYLNVSHNVVRDLPTCHTLTCILALRFSSDGLWMWVLLRYEYISKSFRTESITK